MRRLQRQQQAFGRAWVAQACGLSMLVLCLGACQG
jgi:hypothetical protein